MNAPNVTLRSVVRISSSSIFFTPQEGGTLDFKTVSSTPAAHRVALQNNGLIAKICIGVSVNPNDMRQRREAEEMIYVPEGRLKLWRNLLTANGLIDSVNDVVVPSYLAREPWPVLSDDDYDRRVEYYRSRSQCDEVNQSPFCAPVLHMVEGRQKEHGVYARICVVWMPRYTTDLISWAEYHCNSGRSVPELKLTTVLRHITSGLLTIRAMPVSPSWAGEAVAAAQAAVAAPNTTVTEHSNGGGGRSGSQSREASCLRHDDEMPVQQQQDAVLSCFTNLEMEDVLVNEEDNDLTFLLTVSPYYNQEKLNIVARDINHQKLQYYPYMAPEQVCMTAGDHVPLNMTPTYPVWAMGMMLYAIASGTPSLALQLKRFSKQRKGSSNPNNNSTTGSASNDAMLPMNHPDITPDMMIRRIYRDLEPGSYSSAFASIVALLLSPDYLTRPRLATIDAMMVDLNRAMPVLRFPFALGAFDMLHLSEPSNIQLNARARKYISLDTCCVCKQPRNFVQCKHREHTPSITSPSWSSDEPLPGVMSTENVNISYLYPLAPPLEERDIRRLLNHAIPSSNMDHTAATSTNVSVSVSALPAETASGAMNLNTLFQLFGGFALFDREPYVKPDSEKPSEKITVKDLLLLYPRNGIRKTESPWTPKQLYFSAAFPWPSYCTAALQKKGRCMSPVPPIFGGASTSSAKWFAWILPGEEFLLPNGRYWTPSQDGGFVFWFHELLEPTDQDRYFALTSLRALTIQRRVPRTTMPEKAFRTEALGDESTMRSASHADGGRLSLMTDTQSVPRSSLFHNSTNSKSPSRGPTQVGVTSTAAVSAASALSLAPPPPPEDSGVLPPPQESGGRSVSRQRRPATHSTRRSQLRVKAFAEDDPKSAEVSSAKGNRKIRTVTDWDAVGQLRRPETQPGFRGIHDANVLRVGTAHGADEKMEENTANDGGKKMLSTPTGNPLPVVLRQMNTNQIGSAASQKKEAVQEQQQQAFQPQELPPHHEVSCASTAADLKLSNISSVSAASSCSPFPAVINAGLTAVDPLRAMRLFGCWYAPEMVDVAFESLTFWIPSTGEHGHCQAPAPVTESLRDALRLPLNAAFVSYLSNDVPLLIRNHPKMKSQFPERLLLPHHGLAFFAINASLLGVLGLRCATTGRQNTAEEEVKIAFRRHAAISGTRQRFEANYFDSNNTDTLKKAAGPQWNSRMRHSAPASAVPHLREKVPQAEDLSGISARMLEEHDDQTAYNLGWDDSIPVSWMGFDREQCTLVFAEGLQSCWYPISLECQ